MVLEESNTLGRPTTTRCLSIADRSFLSENFSETVAVVGVIPLKHNGPPSPGNFYELSATNSTEYKRSANIS